MEWKCSPSLCVSSKMQSHSIKFVPVNSFFSKQTKPTHLHFQSTIPIQLTRKYPISNPPQNVFRNTSQKIAILVVGGLIFMTNLGCKPAAAAAAQPPPASYSYLSEDMYLKILERDPRNVETLKVLLCNNMMNGNTKEALKYVDRLVQVQPHEVEWRLLQALSHEMIGNLSMAKKLFKNILSQRPLLLRALHGLAVVMHKNLEGPAVFDMLNQALELAVQEKRVIEERNIRILIAQMHVVKGELEEGLKKFHDLVHENPRDFRPYLCQGIIYSLLNKKKEAEEQFETYRSLVPQEFPQRGFLDDVMWAAKTESHEQLEKEFEAEFSYKKMKRS